MFLPLEINKFYFKVAEHSFEVPMPNSPLTFKLFMLWLITEVFILAFWLGCVLLPWQRGWFKTRLKKMVFVHFKKNPVVRLFSVLHTIN